MPLDERRRARPASTPHLESRIGSGAERPLGSGNAQHLQCSSRGARGDMDRAPHRVAKASFKSAKRASLPTARCAAPAVPTARCPARGARELTRQTRHRRRCAGRSPAMGGGQRRPVDTAPPPRLRRGRKAHALERAQVGVAPVLIARRPAVPARAVPSRRAHAARRLTTRSGSAAAAARHTHRRCVWRVVAHGESSQAASSAHPLVAAALEFERQRSGRRSWRCGRRRARARSRARCSRACADNGSRGAIARSGERRLLTPCATIFSASMSSPESVSSRIASVGSRTSICRISLRFFSPPENPSLTRAAEEALVHAHELHLLAHQPEELEGVHFGQAAVLARGVIGRLQEIDVVHARNLDRILKAEKHPCARALLGGQSAAGRGLRRLRCRRSRCSRAGPASTWARVLLPEPFGPMMACTSPRGT